MAYASSEEDSDAEEAAGEEEESSSSSPPPARGLFADLPPPKAPAVPPLPPPHHPPGSGFPVLPPPPFLMGPRPAPAATGEQPRPGGLLLPPPKNAAPAAPTRSLSPPAGPGAGGDSSLPKPKKRTEPVRIAAPELRTGDVSMKQTGGSRSPHICAWNPPRPDPNLGLFAHKPQHFLALSPQRAPKALPVALVASMGR